MPEYNDVSSASEVLGLQGSTEETGDVTPGTSY